MANLDISELGTEDFMKWLPRINTLGKGFHAETDKLQFIFLYKGLSRTGEKELLLVIRIDNIGTDNPMPGDWNVSITTSWAKLGPRKKIPGRIGEPSGPRKIYWMGDFILDHLPRTNALAMGKQLTPEFQEIYDKMFDAFVSWAPEMEDMHTEWGYNESIPKQKDEKRARESTERKLKERIWPEKSQEDLRLLREVMNESKSNAEIDDLIKEMWENGELDDKRY